MQGTWKTTDSGGGGLVLVVIIAALAIGSGAASAAVSAVVTIALIVTGCVLGLAVLGGIAWLVHRARSERPGRPIAARPVYQLPPESRPHLEESHKPAIGPGHEIHLHFHIADPADAAAIIRQAIPGTAGDAITEGK